MSINPKTVLAVVVSLVVLSVLGALGVLVDSIIKNWGTINELLNKINPFPWISLFVYLVFAIVAARKPVLSEWADFFNVFLFISLILLSLYSLSGEIWPQWPHKYSLGNDIMLGGDEYDYYNGNITPNLIVGLMGVIGFLIAFRTRDASGLALLAMVSFLPLSVLSFHLPQLIDDQGLRLAAIGGVLTVKVGLTLYFISEIKKLSVEG